jgi:ATP-dependent Clp protease, protease subunit
MADVPNQSKCNRRIFITGGINADTTERVVSALCDKEAEDPKKDILLYINSYGGTVVDFLAMHDTIKSLQCKVATICCGNCLSAGAFLLMSGTPGYRYITPHSRALIHQLSSIAMGTLSSMQVDVNEVSRLDKIIRGMLKKYTKLPTNIIDQAYSDDRYFTASEVIKYSLADHILTSNAELYKRLSI